MKKLFIIFCITSLGLLMLSCKKELAEGPQGQQGPPGPPGKNSVNPELYHTWEVVSGMPQTKYIGIKNDNSMHFLYEDPEFGSKSFNLGTAVFTNSQLLWMDRTYNYEIKGDMLTLSNTNEVIRAKRNDTGPTMEAWVVPISSEDSTDMNTQVNFYPSDIAFDGQYLWGSDNGGNVFWNVNPVSKTFAGNVTFPNIYGYPSVAFANSELWVSQDNMVKKIDLATGNELQASPQMGYYQIAGMAFDGQYLWCNATGYDSLYKYDPVSNSILSRQRILWALGTEYVNGYLYVCSVGGYIYKCSPSPFKVIATYRIKSAMNQIYGIAYDGSRFWITIQNKYTYKYELHKVGL